MSIVNNLPSKPTIPKDTNNQKAMLEYQQKMTEYNFSMQIIQQTQSEDSATRTNINKSRHEAMMAIIGNLK